MLKFTIAVLMIFGLAAQAQVTMSDAQIEEKIKSLSENFVANLDKIIALELELVNRAKYRAGINPVDGSKISYRPGKTERSPCDILNEIESSTGYPSVSPRLKRRFMELKLELNWKCSRGHFETEPAGTAI